MTSAELHCSSQETESRTRITMDRKLGQFHVQTRAKMALNLFVEAVMNSSRSRQLRRFCNAQGDCTVVPTHPVLEWVGSFGSGAVNRGSESTTCVLITSRQLYTPRRNPHQHATICYKHLITLLHTDKNSFPLNFCVHLVHEQSWSRHRYRYHKHSATTNSSSCRTKSASFHRQPELNALLS